MMLSLNFNTVTFNNLLNFLKNVLMALKAKLWLGN